MSGSIRTAMGLLSMIVLAGCSTSSVDSDLAAASHNQAVGPAPVTSGHGQCVDPGSPAVKDAVKSLAPAVGARYWTVDDYTHAALGNCPKLMFVRVNAAEGADAPYHVLFFDEAGFLSTANPMPTIHTKVLAGSDRAVSVEYRWQLGGEPYCCPAGGPVVVTYNLDKRTVTADKTLPDVVLNGWPQPARSR